MELTERAAFYDTQAGRKLKDFTHCNGRVERAWSTICAWAGDPSRILEIGCGVGSICWRMSKRFPAAEIVGVDFSRGNLDIAGRFFGASNLRYVRMSVDDDFEFGAFDLMILMDVYEHVAVTDRQRLHENIRRSLTPDGIVIITVPTPRHLAWLRANCPGEIQPVDEDVTPDVLCRLARELERSLLMYAQVDVWRKGDYAHAVVGRSHFPEDLKPAWVGSKLAFHLRSLTRRLRIAMNSIHG